MVEPQQDRGPGGMHVVEHPVTVRIEGPCRQEPGNLRAGKAEAVQPATRRRRVDPHRTNVLEWNLELAAQ